MKPAGFPSAPRSLQQEHFSIHQWVCCKNYNGELSPPSSQSLRKCLCKILVLGDWTFPPPNYKCHGWPMILHTCLIQLTFTRGGLLPAKTQQTQEPSIFQKVQLQFRVLACLSYKTKPPQPEFQMSSQKKSAFNRCFLPQSRVPRIRQ